ncbi:hypothetical protein [Erwinia oleae]|uniref:hypothetical protein n=1 Tax=Erwinia oleae TaxID=796334 RepID=UPI0005542131|nr:hypothetical protein [Erwinia oleae]
MKLLSKCDSKKVSGGNLSSDIMDALNPGRTPSEKGDWTSPSTIDSPAIGQGDVFGKIFVGVAAVAVSIFAVGLGGIFSLFNRK